MHVASRTSGESTLAQSRPLSPDYTSATSTLSFDVGESKHQQVYRKDAATLGEIGAVLLRADLPEIEVRLPDTLARAAVEAWEFDDEGPLDAETVEQRLLRGRAATLALIGLAVSERGRADGNEVLIALSPDLIGLAVDAADDLPDSALQ